MDELCVHDQPSDKEEDKKLPELSQWQCAMHKISLLILPRCRLKLNVNVSYCWRSSYWTKKKFQTSTINYDTWSNTSREQKVFFCCFTALNRTIAILPLQCCSSVCCVEHNYRENMNEKLFFARLLYAVCGWLCI